jgi:5'-methylthioadenosine phosphorylase
MKKRIGIIGGTGLYEMEGLSEIKRESVKTPFGDPSDEYITGVLEGRDVVFLPRHGVKHMLLPSEINYKANIYGMKMLGVEWIIAVAAVGSLKLELKPLDIVIPDQFLDRTSRAREMTFFGDGICAHIGLAEPVCPDLVDVLYDTARSAGATAHKGGTYVNIEGPAFSTKAESNLYRKWDMDIIGMTNMAEAKLAREAEICYVTMACVTDYDCWYQDESVEDVNVEMIVQNLRKNEENSKKVLRHAVSKIPQKRRCVCQHALKGAIITSPDRISPGVRKRLDAIIGKYLK